MTVIDELQRDHVNLGRLLEILDRKIIKLKSGHHPNFNLMADVVDYIANYAEEHHHPREDKIYAHFKGRDEQLDQALLECEAQHVELRGNAEKLLSVIDDILNDAVIPMDEFIAHLELFVENEKSHMRMEEIAVFPLIRDVATGPDWEHASALAPAVNDPLFGERLADEYRDLYQQLLDDIEQSA